MAQAVAVGTDDENRSTGLVLAALGVVYGDIGTSPLYMMREAFGHVGGLHVEESTVLGVLSLAFWALILVVTVKYVLVVLNADNRGEGGVLALAALAQRGLRNTGRRRRLAVILAMIGAALFYGDGVITPSISVLSAVEGLKIATHLFEPYVVPLAVVILVGIFLLQRRGTARVGRLFGPIMCVWFVTLGLLGIAEITHNPTVLRALNPLHAADFFLAQGWTAFLALGAVVLAVTGAEALYADMGHFGPRPIRFAWTTLVLPALALNYFGQGALLLREPTAVSNPFYLLAPEWALFPMVLLATCATVIASQAVISGAFSLTRQAIQLGYLPRLEIRHTSESEIGQVYLPHLNWLLMVAVVAVVVGFGSSSNLAAAYGVAVTAAMSIDSVLAFAVAITIWRWRTWTAALLFGSFLIIDLALFGATALKIPEGGWFPLILATMLFAVISTWRRGREVLFERLYADAVSLRSFIERLVQRPPLRVPGTAVFLTSSLQAAPLALLHNLKHNKVLHERVVVLTVVMEDVPKVPESERLRVDVMEGGFYRLLLHYGFLDTPDVPAALSQCHHHCGPPFNLMETSFFVNRERLIASGQPDLAPWREHIYIGLSHLAQDATEFFQIPVNRVVELGTRVEI